VEGGFGPELAKIRLREVRAKDSLLSLRLLARGFNHATPNQPPDDSSGVVEMLRFCEAAPMNLGTVEQLLISI